MGDADGLWLNEFSVGRPVDAEVENTMTRVLVIVISVDTLTDDVSSRVGRLADYLTVPDIL